MKNTSSRNSDSSSHFDSPHSPLRFRSSPLSDGGDPFHSTENSPENDNSRAIVIIEPSLQYSQVTTPIPDSEHRNPPPNDHPAVVVNRAMRTDPPPSATNLGHTVPGGGREDGGGRSRPRTNTPTTTSWSKSDVTTGKVALGFRLSEVVLCLISFSVMAADKTQGWSGDSFDRYKEYRFLLLNLLLLFCYSYFIETLFLSMFYFSVISMLLVVLKLINDVSIMGLL